MSSTRVYGYRYGEYTRWYLGFKNRQFFFFNRNLTLAQHTGCIDDFRHATIHFSMKHFSKWRVYCLSSRLIKLLKPFTGKTRNKSVVGQNEKYRKARLTWRPGLNYFYFGGIVPWFFSAIPELVSQFAKTIDLTLELVFLPVLRNSRISSEKSRIWNGLCFTLVGVRGLKIGYWNNQYMLILWYWFVSPLLIIKSRNTISHTLDKKFRDNLPNSSMVH